MPILLAGCGDDKESPAKSSVVATTSSQVAATSAGPNTAEVCTKLGKLALYAETAYHDAELAALIPDNVPNNNPARSATLRLLMAEGNTLLNVPKALADDVATIVTAAEQTADALAAEQPPGAATAPMRSTETSAARAAITAYLESPSCQ